MEAIGHKFFHEFYIEYNNIGIDNNKLKNECYILEKNLPSTNNSNVGGRQTENIVKKDVEKYKCTEFDKLTKILEKDIFDSLIDYFKPRGPRSSIGLGNIWININNKSASNRLHSHPFSLISGVYYVDIPEDSGNLIFKREQRFFDHRFSRWATVDSDSIKCIKPEPGKLILFPSYLMHYVEENNNTLDRISIAFNLHD